MATLEDWIGGAGADWAAHVAATDAALEPFGEEARTRLALGEGEHVLDLGCGAGASTMMLASDVGDSGRVTAIDVSPDLVRMALNRTAGHPSIEVIETDASTYDFGDRRFEALFSRFGCTYFSDPTAAWANLHRALKPEGRVSLVAWRSLEENDWARVPLQVVEELFGEEPSEIADGLGRPGPFAWADPEVFEPLLEGAGFREVVREKYEKRVPYGTGAARNSLDRAVEMMLRIGPMARRLRDTDEETHRKAAKRLRRLLKPYDDDDAVRMTGRAWLITARA